MLENSAKRYVNLLKASRPKQTLEYLEYMEETSAWQWKSSNSNRPLEKQHSGYGLPAELSVTVEKDWMKENRRLEPKCTVPIPQKKLSQSLRQ